MDVVGDRYVVAQGAKIPLADVRAFSWKWYWTGSRLVPRHLRPFFASRIRMRVRIAYREPGGDVTSWCLLAEDEPMFDAPTMKALEARGIPRADSPFGACEAENNPSFALELSPEDRATLLALPKHTLVLDEREFESRAPLVDPEDFERTGQAGPYRLYRILDPLIP